MDRQLRLPPCFSTPVAFFFAFFWGGKVSDSEFSGESDEGNTPLFINPVSLMGVKAAGVCEACPRVGMMKPD